MTPSFPTRRASDRVALPQRQRGAARQAREDRDGEDADGDDGIDGTGAEDRGDHHRREQRRKGEGEVRSEEHTTELQTLMRISYAASCLTNKRHETHTTQPQ